MSQVEDALGLVTRTFVVFLTRGNEESLPVQVESRSLKAIVVPDNAFGFYFYDRLEVRSKRNGRHLILRSEETDHSPRYLLRGERVHREKVRQVLTQKGSSAFDETFANFIADLVVTGEWMMTRTGDLLHLEPSDILLPA